MDPIAAEPATASASATVTAAHNIFEDLQISPNDERLYRHLILSNQLQVLLISDPTTEKCSACCDVEVGSLADPGDIQGLAHFLEHMLFMGTEVYPLENEYSVYINAHGGYSNAYTSIENTVYYFDIQNTSFEHALDVFSTFFWCPIFDESAVSRELQAVDSENTKNLQADSWRTYQLLKSIAHPLHPINKFSTGNLETLKTIPDQMGINLRERLLQFHREYYSSNLMTLVLYGNQPLDVLQRWAEEKFTPIVNKNLKKTAAVPPSLTLPLPPPAAADVTDTPVVDTSTPLSALSAAVIADEIPLQPFGPEQLGVLIELVPVKDLKDVEIYIPLPAVRDDYRSASYSPY
jgi:insulysin